VYQALWVPSSLRLIGNFTLVPCGDIYPEKGGLLPLVDLHLTKFEGCGEGVLVAIGDCPHKGG
jgi:hypothetical protein